MNALAEPWMDDLEAGLGLAATRVSTRLRARRRSARIATAAMLATLVVGGGALAETTPFHPLASFRGLLGAQRPLEPGDAVFPPLRGRFTDQPAFAAIDHARLLATLPGGSRLYAFPGRKGRLCLLYREGFDPTGVIACRPSLTSSIPIAPLTSVGRGRATVVVGVARDDVRSLSFRVRGVLQTVPVDGNVFWFSDASGPPAPRAFTAHFADGTSAVYPRSARTP
ncbi:MAG TPA: hypothetical protein VGK92_08165 [Gaiellales bacterium]|jgi:hypothetical protein